VNRETITSKKYVRLFDPATVTADSSSRYLDTQGFDTVDIVVVYSDVTASAGANNFVIKVQEKDATPGTASGYTDVAAADLRGTFPVLQENVTANVAAVGYVGDARYLRVLIDETGTASATIAVVAVLGLSDRDPANSKTVTTGAVS